MEQPKYTVVEYTERDGSQTVYFISRTFKGWAIVKEEVAQKQYSRSDILTSRTRPMMCNCAGAMNHPNTKCRHVVMVETVMAQENVL